MRELSPGQPYWPFITGITHWLAGRPVIQPDRRLASTSCEERTLPADIGMSSIS